MSAINERIKIIVDKFANGKNTELARILSTSEANIRNYTSNVMPKFDILSRIVLSDTNHFFSNPCPFISSAHEITRAFPLDMRETPFSLIFSSTVYGSVEGILGGAKGIRTPDLLNAIQALSQLSYSPIAQRGVFYTPDSILSIKRGISSGNRYRSRPKAEIAWSAYRNDGTLSALSAACGVPFMQTGR